MFKILYQVQVSCRSANLIYNPTQISDRDINDSLHLDYAVADPFTKPL